MNRSVFLYFEVLKCVFDTIGLAHLLSLFGVVRNRKSRCTTFRILEKSQEGRLHKQFLMFCQAYLENQIRRLQWRE